MKKRLVKVTAIALLSALTLGVFAACGGGKTSSTAGKTHDQATLQVAGKDTYEPHNFVDGKCKMCAETTTFLQTPLHKAKPELVNTACDQQGTIEEITYEYTKNDGTKGTKIAYVYLPYGYNAEDKSTKYDVLIMLHGMGLNEGFWFAKGTYTPEAGNYASTGKNFTQNVLDTMMKEGTAKKAICVSPSYYATGTQTQDSNFASELTTDLLPYIVENYNTYAADATEASLKANRDHQAYVGLSLGSAISYSTVLTSCVDYFSYIGSFSGATSINSAETIGQNIAANWSTYPIKYWYSCAGSLETNKDYPGDPFGCYRKMVETIPGLKPGSDIAAGQNCTYMLCDKTAHNYSTWITALYNVMTVFFK